MNDHLKNPLCILGGLALIALVVLGWKYTDAIKERNILEKRRIGSVEQVTGALARDNEQANSKPRVNTVDEALKCNQLYELKKTKYWGTGIGQSKALYSQDLNTCLALNIYNNPDTKEYAGMVIDMADDKTLLYHNSTPKGFYFEGENGNKKVTCEFSYNYLEFLKDGKKVKEFGCEKLSLLDKMFEQIRAFGFTVFSG